MMKPKNANFFQLHIEKVVVAAALLIAAGVLLLYVIGNPWAVEVDGRAVAPAQVPKMVADAAGQLRTELGRSDPGLPDQTVPQYVRDFRQQATLPIQTRDRLAAINEPGITSRLTNPADLPRYDMPLPPVPADVVAHAEYGVLDTTGDVQTDRDLAQITRISDRGPADFRYVTVGAKFDMEQWRQRLAAETENPVPQHMWNNSLYIAGVFLQRRELIDPVRNEWSDPIVVAKMPLQQGYEPGFSREEYASSSELADQDIAFVRQNQEMLARTPFVPMGPQVVYRPPYAKRLTLDEGRELAKLSDRKAKLQEQLDRRMEQLTRTQQRAATQAERERSRTGTRQPMMPTGPGGYEEDMGGGYFEDDGGMMGGPMAGGSRPNTNRMTPQQRLEFEVQRIQSELTTIQQRTRELLGPELLEMLQPTRTQTGQQGYFEGMDPYAGGYGGYEQEMMEMDMGGFDPMTGEPLDPYMQGPYGQPTGPGGRPLRPGEQPEPIDQRIEVRAHDLTVEPGKTYQYRVLVSVLNPLFRQNRVNPEQKKQYFNRLTIGPSPDEVATSPWSEEVTVHKNTYFFVTSADSSRQSAEIEVWRLYDGKWRQQQFTVEPGDPMGGTATITTRSGQEVPLPMLVDGMAVDMVDQMAGGISDTRFYYVQPETDQFLTRDVREDQNDPIRIQLQNEAAISEQILSAGAQASIR